MGNKHQEKSKAPEPTRNFNSKQQKKEIVILQSQHNDFLVCQDQQSLNKALALPEWKQVLQGKRAQPSEFITIRWLLSGVPDHIRLQVWEHFTKVDQLASIKYFKLMEEVPQTDSARQIQLDLVRTFSKFSKIDQTLKCRIIESLRRILRAYACHDRELGYTQGINFLLANMLSYLLYEGHYQLCQRLEERVLKVLIGVMFYHSYRLFFIDKTPKLFEMCECLQKSVKATFPQIDRKINFLHLNYSSLFTSYYMTVFCYSDPSEKVGKKLIDLFTYLGPPVINSLIIKMFEEYQHLINDINEATQLASFFKSTMFSLLEDQQLQIKDNFLQSALSPWRIAK